MSADVVCGVNRHGSRNPIDVHIGRQVARRRLELGMSEQRLAQALGITKKQLAGHENGFVRVGADRLFGLTKVLAVEVGYFYRDLSCMKNGSAQLASQCITPSVTFESRELARHFNSITDLDHRRITLKLVKDHGRISAQTMKAT